MTYCLAVSAVVAMNRRLVEQTAEPHAVLSMGNLEGALARPLASFGGVEVFATLPAKAGALLDGIAQAHAFLQGNKRTAWLAAVTYLGINGLSLVGVSQDEAADVVLRVVVHELDAQGVAVWLADRLEFV